MKKLDVNQELCRKVQIMLAGAKAKEVAGLLGISETTVSRIKAAGFDPEQYARNTQKRVEEENKINFPLTVEKVEETEDGVKVTARQAEEQCAGQISMEDLQAEAQKPEMTDQTKLMRFIAGQMDKRERNAQIYTAEIITHMVKIEDYIAQILRKMDG